MRTKPTYLTTDVDIVAYKIVDKKMTCTLDGYVHTKHGYSLPVHEPGKTIRATVDCFGSIARAIECSKLSNDSIPLRCVIPRGSAIAIHGVGDAGPMASVGPMARITSDRLYVDKILSWQDAFDQYATEESKWYIYGAIEIPDIEYNYPGVEMLTLMASDVSSLPSGIRGLTGLLTMDLSLTNITDIPEAIYSLTSLESLDLSQTRIRSISKDIARLESIHCLDLSQTAIESLPEEIFKMKSLRSIKLSECMNLHRLPRLPQLNELFLDGLVLESIDEELLDISHISNLYMWNTTIESLTDTQMDTLMSENCSVYGSQLERRILEKKTIGGNQNDV